jgi:hypothetical protein
MSQEKFGRVAVLSGTTAEIDMKNLTHSKFVDLFTERDLSTSLKDVVYEAIKNAGKWGATVDEIMAAYSVSAGTVKARRVELERDGLISDSGMRRLSLRGRPTKVYIAT